MKNKKQLDDITLDIEFLLISVIQGVALATLCSASIDVFNHLRLEYFPYIVTGFLFILIFWSSAIIHAISFIDWPFELNHTFLYFLASFLEIMALNNISNPLAWFAFLAVFQFVAAGLYLYDLSIVKKRRPLFGKTKFGKIFYQNIVNQQKKELTIFLPIALVFNIAGFLLIVFSPQLFITNHYHVLFISLQLLFTVAFLLNSISSYKKRSRLMNAVINEKSRKF